MKGALICDAASIKDLAVDEIVSISMLKVDRRFFSFTTAEEEKQMW